MGKICKNLIKIFNYLIVFFPLVIAVFLGCVYLSGGWENLIDGHTFEYYYLTEIKISKTLVGLIILWLIAVACLTYLLCNISKYISNHKLRKIILIILIFILAFVVRYLLSYMYRDDLVPFSDFARAWERARGNLKDGKMAYYGLFPAYMNFSVYENLVINFLGESFINIIYVNSIYCGITAVFLFLITSEIVDNNLVCILSGVIYALYPSNVFYITTATPEFITVLFNTIGVYALIKAFKNKDFVYKLIWVIIGGISLGIGSSFKTYSVVMMLAFVMILIAKHIIDNVKYSKHEILTVCLLISVGILSYKCVMTSILNETSQHFNMVLTTDKAIPHFLLVGLNTESEGQYHVGSLSSCYKKYYLSNGLDYKEAKDYAYTLLKNDWKNNTEKIIPNFGRKMIWAWQDDYMPIYYFLTSVGIMPDSVNEIFVYNTVEKYGAGVSQIVYISIMFFALIAVWSIAKKKDIDLIKEFLLLIIFGYFCMIFIAEAQSRYKCLVMPYIIIFASIGVGIVLKEIKRMIMSRKSKSLLTERKE